MGKNLQQTLCQKNNPKLQPNSELGVKKLDCSYNEKNISESKKKVLTRCIEHQQDSMNGKWEASGATGRTNECHGQFD